MPNTTVTLHFRLDSQRMNRYDWNNPPPPGTEFDIPDEDSNFSSQKNDSMKSGDQGSNQIESPVESPVLQGRDDGISSEKTRLRSRSKSPERRRRRRRSRSYSRRSRSYSRDRRRRSRSRSRRRRRRLSSSRSRSRSPSLRHRHRRHGRHYSRSRSRSQTTKTKSHNSRSGSRSHSRSRRSERDKKSPKSKSRHVEERQDSDYTDKELDGDVIGEEDMKIEDPEEELPIEPEPEPDQGPIPFKNDGSFLEMFKRMQEQQKAVEEPPSETAPKKSLLPPFGKRRGGKVLKTGMVAKVRNMEQESNNAQDAWSVYMKEVRKYKEVHCDDDSKTRPLVK